MTSQFLAAAPTPGEIVRVRQRQYFVEDVEPPPEAELTSERTKAEAAAAPAAEAAVPRGGGREGSGPVQRGKKAGPPGHGGLFGEQGE
jgi:hypothetical protein